MDGVIEPKHASSRLVFSIFMLLQLGVVVGLLSVAGSAAVEQMTAYVAISERAAATMASASKEAMEDEQAHLRTADSRALKHPDM